MVVLLGESLAGAGLMNEKARVFFVFFFFMLQSARDREWPIAINVDQPKLLPEQQSDRVWSRRGIEIVSPRVCVALQEKEEEGREKWLGKRK